LVLPSHFRGVLFCRTFCLKLERAVLSLNGDCLSVVSVRVAALVRYGCAQVATPPSNLNLPLSLFLAGAACLNSRTMDRPSRCPLLYLSPSHTPWWKIFFSFIPFHPLLLTYALTSDVSTRNTCILRTLPADSYCFRGLGISILLRNVYGSPSLLGSFFYFFSLRRPTGIRCEPSFSSRVPDYKS